MPPSHQAVMSFNGHVGLNDTCAVCLEQFKDDDAPVSALPCQHGFHTGCIQPWILTHANCPVCREQTGDTIQRTEAPRTFSLREMSLNAQLSRHEIRRQHSNSRSRRFRRRILRMTWEESNTAPNQMQDRRLREQVLRVAGRDLQSLATRAFQDMDDLAWIF